MAVDEPWQDPKSPQDARLASLDERLAKAQADEAARIGPKRRVLAKGEAELGRILTVLASYPAGSALIGYAIDRFAGTRWVMVTMLFVGFVVAMWEIWKLSKLKAD